MRRPSIFLVAIGLLAGVVFAPSSASAQRSGSIWDNMRPGMTVGLVESAAAAERMAWKSLSNARSVGVAGSSRMGYSSSYTPRGQTYAGTVGDSRVGFASFSTAVGRGGAYSRAGGSYTSAASGRMPGGSYYARSAGVR